MLLHPPLPVRSLNDISTLLTQNQLSEHINIIHDYQIHAYHSKPTQDANPTNIGGKKKLKHNWFQYIIQQV